jgi:polyisoprenoid-binding protein YceI
MKLFATLSLVALLSFNATAEVTPAPGKVDIAKSKIVWTGKKVTGQHTGNIILKSGSLEFNKNVLTGGMFEMDMSTITCTDLTGEYAGKLIGHLKSDDFFSVEKFRTASFKITKVMPGSKANTYRVEGNMTIKGITAPVSFETMLDGAKASARIVIDRTKYDIKYGSGSFFDNLGDKAIDNNFELDVTLAYSI